MTDTKLREAFVNLMFDIQSEPSVSRCEAAEKARIGARISAILAAHPEPTPELPSLVETMDNVRQYFTESHTQLDAMERDIMNMLTVARLRYAEDMVLPLIEAITKRPMVTGDDPDYMMVDVSPRKADTLREALAKLVEKLKDWSNRGADDKASNAFKDAALELEDVVAAHPEPTVELKAAIALLWSAYPVAGYARSQLRRVFALLGEIPPDPDEPTVDPEQAERERLGRWLAAGHGRTWYGPTPCEETKWKYSLIAGVGLAHEGVDADETLALAAALDRAGADR